MTMEFEPSGLRKIDGKSGLPGVCPDAGPIPAQELVDLKSRFHHEEASIRGSMEPLQYRLRKDHSACKSHH